MSGSVGGGAATIDGRAEKEGGMRPADPIGGQATASQEAYASLARYPLLDALIKRRSHRFGEGMRLNGGPLAYNSTPRNR